MVLRFFFSVFHTQPGMPCVSELVFCGCPAVDDHRSANRLPEAIDRGTAARHGTLSSDRKSGGGMPATGSSAPAAEAIGGPPASAGVEDAACAAAFRCR